MAMQPQKRLKSQKPCENVIQEKKAKNTWIIWKCNWSFRSQLISVFSLTGWDSITGFLIQSQIKIRQNQRIPVPDSTFHIDRKVFYYKMNITMKQVQLFFKHKNETGSSIASNLLILALFHLGITIIIMTVVFTEIKMFPSPLFPLSSSSLSS